MSATAVRLSMPKKRGLEPKEDHDYEPYDSFDEDERIKQQGGSVSQLLRSSRGRLVKAKQYSEDPGSEEDDYQEKRTGYQSARPGQDSRNQSQAANARPRGSQQPPRAKQAKRQRWVPHNPHIMGRNFDDDEDSKDVQISDDDETGDEGASRPRRRVSESRMKGGSVPVRDEAGKFVGVRPQTAAERRQASALGKAGGGGGIFKTAAVTVLREEKRLMSTGEIARIALKRGYIKVQGRTPEATMASAMYTDVKRKEDRSTFIRPHEGLFGLREWVEEGIDFKDPAQDKFPEESMHGAVRRSRLGSQSIPRASSRSSNAGPRAQSHHNSPAYDPFLPHTPASQSQANSNHGESVYAKEDFPAEMPDIASHPSIEEVPIGLPPRLTAGLPGIEAKVSHAALNGRGYSTQHSTPFGSNRGGPSVEIFKSRFADGNARSGFTPSGKRSMSGSLLPAFQQPQRANSSGRKQRKPGPNMASADSGNMLLLLSAVDQSMERAANSKLGYLQKPLPGLERRQLSGTLRRELGEDKQVQLTVQGFNATRIAAGHALGQGTASTSQSNQVNILNLPLPDVHIEEGNLDGDVVLPEDVDFDPANVTPASAVRVPQPHNTPPPGAEAHLQALDHAFGRAPLPILGSLSGGLAPTFSVPNELPPLITPLASTEIPKLGGTGPETNSLPRPPSNAILQLGMKPGSAFSAATSPSQPACTANLLQDFGVPEEGAKRLPEVEAAVRSLEGSLGDRHPKVGKGYLYLSKVYQCVATPEFYQKAQQALHHAYEICFACQITEQNEVP